jgi:hypothetical protein
VPRRSSPSFVAGCGRVQHLLVTECGSVVLVLELSPWLRQPDRNDDATRRVAPETGRGLGVWNEFYSSAFFPSPRCVRSS